MGLLTDLSFKINDIKRYIKSVAEHEHSPLTIWSKIVNDDGLHGVLIKGGIAKMDGHDTLYVKKVTEVLWK